MAEKGDAVVMHQEQSSISSHSDVEKTKITEDRRDVESDRVTLKTWSVVIVSHLISLKLSC